MNYEKFCKILNKHIFESEKKELLQKIADKPERFIGLFRPTKPRTKVLQHLLQSHEIRFGDAIEEIISELLIIWGYKVLPKIIIPDPSNPRRTLDIDQYFTSARIYYFIEQKVRDDHDSTKKRGQINNFETKLEFLYRKHKSNLKGVMYFIDPDLIKNKNYYLEQLSKMTEIYGVELTLLYGKELFEFFNKSEVWDAIIKWLTQWKENLPELPEINFDKEARKSFEEIKDLEIRFWRKILENEKLWEEEIIEAIFREGKTLKILLDFFNSQTEIPYKNLSNLLNQKLEKYF
jgi:hypothetical protein